MCLGIVKGGKSNKMQMSKDKRGLSIVSTIVGLVVVGVVLAIGFLILNAVMTSDSVTGDAQDAVNATILALAEIPNWLPILVIVIIAGIILAVVLAVIARKAGGGEAI